MSDWTRVEGMIEGLAGLIVNVVQHPSSSSRRQRGVPGVSSPGTPSTLGMKATRIAQPRATGYSVYTTSSGWLGYPDEKVRRLAGSLSGARA